MLQRLFIFYLYLRFIVRLTAKWWLRVLYWVPTNRRASLLGLLCQQCFCHSLSSFSCLQLPNYCWSYLPAPLYEHTEMILYGSFV